MKEWIEKFLQSIPNRNTAAAYRNDLEQFVSFLSEFRSAGARPITRFGDAAASHFQEYRFFLQERGYAQTTLARKLAAVRALYRFLEGQSEAKAEITVALGKQSVERQAPDILSRADITDLLGAPARASGRYPTRDTALLYLLYYTELRASALLSLNLSDVTPDGKSLQVGKNGGELMALAHPACKVLSTLIEELQAKSTAADQPLFQNHRSERLTRQGLWTIVRKHLPHTNIQVHLTVETLRHSHAAHKQHSI